MAGAVNIASLRAETSCAAWRLGFPVTCFHFYHYVIIYHYISLYHYIIMIIYHLSWAAWRLGFPVTCFHHHHNCYHHHHHNCYHDHFHDDDGDLASPSPVFIIFPWLKFQNTSLTQSSNIIMLMANEGVIYVPAWSQLLYSLRMARKISLKWAS